MRVNNQPLTDYVVAQQEIAATKTASSLYLPGTTTKKPKIAKVVAVIFEHMINKSLAAQDFYPKPN